MATNDELRIVVRAEIDDALKSFNKISSAAAKTAKEADKSLAGMLSGFKTALTGAGIFAAFQAVKSALSFAFDTTKEYAEFKQATDAMATQFGKNADDVIKQLNKVSGGTISNKDLVIAANRAMALNVTQDVGKMAKLLEYARLRARALGTDTTAAFNDIVTGIGRGSPMILDNLGIITKGWDDEAKAAGKSFDTQFILNKVLADAGKELARTGPLTLTTAEKIKVFEIATQNVHKNIGKVIASVMDNGGLVDSFTAVSDGINKVVKSEALVRGISATFLTIQTVLGLSINGWKLFADLMITQTKIIGNILMIPVNLIKNLIPIDFLRRKAESLGEIIQNGADKIVAIIKIPWVMFRNLIGEERIKMAWEFIVKTIALGSGLIIKTVSMVGQAIKTALTGGDVSAGWKKNIANIIEESKGFSTRTIKSAKETADGTVKIYDALTKKLNQQNKAAVIERTAETKAAIAKETDFVKLQYEVRSKYAMTALEKDIERIVTAGKTYQAMEEEIMRLEQDREMAQKTKQLAKFKRIDEEIKKQKELLQSQKDEAINIQAAYDGFFSIISQIGNAIGGEMGKAITGVANFGKALLSAKTPADVMVAVITAAIGVIVTEIEKANKAMEMSQANSVKIMTDVWKAGIDEQIRVLEGRQALENKLLADKQAAEISSFESTSAAAVALKALKEQEAADAYAAMTAQEQAKFDVQKRYDDERKALELQQEKEKKELAEKQKIERNKAKKSQFDANRDIQATQARIDWAKADSEVHKTYWAPWDEPSRKNLLNQNRSLFGGIINLIRGQEFIPEYAAGTLNARAGMALVGERGPELINFRGGEQVVPNNRISNITQNQGQTFQIGNLNLNGVQDVRGLAMALENLANGMGKTIFA